MVIRNDSRLSKIKCTLLTALLIFIAYTASAEVRVTLTAEPAVLRIGERGMLNLSFFGVTEVEPPDFPAIDGLNIRYIGPFEQIIYDQGTMRRTLTFRYQVIARNPGDYQIGPYVMQMGSREIDIPELTLEVVEQGDDAAGDDQDLSERLFARITTDPERIYSRQVFNIMLSIYIDTRLSIAREIRLDNMPPSGLNVERFHELSSQREVIDGRVYNVRRFRARAHALSSGDYTLAPRLHFGIIVPREQHSPADPFNAPGFEMLFGRQQTRGVDLFAEPTTLKVLPLPTAGRPETYTGAVGLFQFEAEVQPRTVQEGQPITVTMKITGHGNIATVTPPSLDLHDDFRTYDLRLIDEDINPATSYGTRVFEQVIIPRTTDIDQIPAVEFSYFDTGSEKYISERSGPFPIKVSAAPQPDDEPARFVTRPSEAVLGEDIAHLKPPPARLRKSPLFFNAQHPAYWAVQMVPLLALGFAVIRERRKRRLQNNRALARRLRAPRVARRALRNAEQALDNNLRTGFFEAAWQALADYFGDHFNLPPGEVSAEKIKQAVQVLEDGDRRWLNDFCDRCDRIRFGGGNNNVAFSVDEQEMARKDVERLREILRSCERLDRQAKSMRNSCRSGLILAILLSLPAYTATVHATDETPPTDTNLLFNKASDAYGGKRWEDARTIYRGLKEQGLLTPELFYNIGNTNYRLEEWAAAMLNYRRAWWMKPRDAEILNNIAMTRRKSGALLPEYSWHERAAMYLAFDEWSIIFSIALWLGAGLTIFSILRAPSSSIVRRTALSAWILALVALPGLLLRARMERNAEAVVIAKDLQAYFAPLAHSTAHFTLPAGSVVRVLAHDKDWVEIQTANRRGWIEKRHLHPLFPLQPLNTVVR